MVQTEGWILIKSFPISIFPVHFYPNVFSEFNKLDESEKKSSPPYISPTSNLFLFNRDHCLRRKSFGVKNQSRNKFSHHVLQFETDLYAFESINSLQSATMPMRICLNRSIH